MKRKTFYKIILLIIFIVIIFLIILKKQKNEDLFQDFLFTKLISNSNVISNANPPKCLNNEIKYIFDISYKNTKLQSISLQNTINKNTLANEKIAPGTRGNFNIVIKTNKDTNYQIKFISKNKKPKNLKFKAKCNDKYIAEEKNNLEDLSEFLCGKIYNNEEKIITIEWYWDYEISEKDNEQDTFDAKNLREYKFDIYTSGTEVDAI